MPCLSSFELYSRRVPLNVQQTFFVPAKKHEFGEEHDTCLLLKSYYSYGNVFYFISKDV